jgi:hypothetical protein
MVAAALRFDQHGKQAPRAAVLAGSRAEDLTNLENRAFFGK